MNIKPLGGPSYGSIPHLPGSRLGPGDHHCHQGQADICTVKTRDKKDTVIVQEKLDGSNVGVAKIGGEIVALTRAGYLASTSPYKQHHYFDAWVERNAYRFKNLLNEGERICGEWMLQAHGTRYKLWGDPFVAFDLITPSGRLTYNDLYARIGDVLKTPALLHEENYAVDLTHAIWLLQNYGIREGPYRAEIGTIGGHGALEQPEGVVYRVERDGKVDFLAKYVRPDKVDGAYLGVDSHGNEIAVWNEGTEEIRNALDYQIKAAQRRVQESG